MSQKPTGYGLMQIGGQERPFQVGTNQGDIFCRLQHRRGEDGGPLPLKDYSALFSLEALKAEKLTGGDLRDFVYSALVAGYENDGLRVDFTAMQVGNWLDDTPLHDSEEVIKPLREMLAQVVRKTEQAIERAKKDQAPTPKPGKGLSKKATD